MLTLAPDTPPAVYCDIWPMNAGANRIAQSLSVLKLDQAFSEATASLLGQVKTSVVIIGSLNAFSAVPMELLGRETAPLVYEPPLVMERSFLARASQAEFPDVELDF